METYYQRNKEKLKVYSKKYAAEHGDKYKKYWEKYRKKNIEQRSQYYKDWYQKNGRIRSDISIEAILEWQRNNPEKVKIQQQLNSAIKKGEIARSTACSRCKKKGKMQAHHTDYEHYLNFIWLCASCHKRIHGNLY